MPKRLPVIFVLAACQAAATQAAEPRLADPDHPLLHQVAGKVSQAELRTTIEHLVGFGTRHTLSDTRSETRGVGAARRWVQASFNTLSGQCGGCLVVETPAETLTGARVPSPTEVVDVVAIQPGTMDPDRVVIVSAHVDSRNSDVMNATRDAPGANDDGSGVAVVMEAARVLSKHRFPATIVYAVLSGEEQGLLGGGVLARYAKAKGWRVEAQFNNDIVGNTHGEGGAIDSTHLRVFSEGTKALETPAEASLRRLTGGELDSPSRSLGRFLDGLAPRYVKGLSVRMVYRSDRFGRGGDQKPLQEAGFPAVRLTEAAENFDRQHQDVRTENGRPYGDVIGGVDFPYLAKVAKLNTVALAAAASAPSPPEAVGIERTTPGTTLTWSPSRGAAGYRVWWRDTVEPRWSHKRSAGRATSLVLDDQVIDDWFFGVSAVSSDGYESPVEFPGAAGAYFPLPAKAP